MAGNKPSITQVQAPLGVLSNIDFDRPEYESMVSDKGTDVYHESAVKCACRSGEAGANQAMSNCMNCGGTGWIFINRTDTRMILYSLNNQTKYSIWSEEKLGTVAITARDIDDLAFMDKITLIKGVTHFSENIYPKIVKDKLFAFTSYDIVKMKNAFMFIKSEEPLKPLIEGLDFQIDVNKIILDDKYKSNLKNIRISLKYSHRPTFHILDIPRDIMVTDILEVTGSGKETKKMPIHAIGRKAHYIADMANMNGSRLYDNSTVTLSNPDEVCS